MKCQLRGNSLQSWALSYEFSSKIKLGVALSLQYNKCMGPETKSLFPNDSFRKFVLPLPKTQICRSKTKVGKVETFLPWEIGFFVFTYKLKLTPGHSGLLWRWKQEEKLLCWQSNLSWALRVKAVNRRVSGEGCVQHPHALGTGSGRLLTSGNSQEHLQSV